MERTFFIHHLIRSPQNLVFIHAPIGRGVAEPTNKTPYINLGNVG